MKRAASWKSVDIDALRKGDRVIALADGPGMPNGFFEETFHKVVSERGYRLVTLKDEGSKHDIYVRDNASNTWVFYRRTVNR